MQSWRHDIHRHPELGFEENRTAQVVAEQLIAWGLEVHREVGRTGVVGVLKRGQGNRSIGLRADMDALPIQEKNEFHTVQKMMELCMPVATMYTRPVSSVQL